MHGLAIGAVGRDKHPISKGLQKVDMGQHHIGIVMGGKAILHKDYGLGFFIGGKRIKFGLFKPANTALA